MYFCSSIFLCLFLIVNWVGLLSENVAFSGHIHLLFCFYILLRILLKIYIYQNQYFNISWLLEGNLFSWSELSKNKISKYT